MISPVLFTVRLTPQSAKSLRAIARTYDCTIEHFLRQAAVYYVKAVGYGEVVPQPTHLKVPEVGSEPTELKAPEAIPKLTPPPKRRAKRKVTVVEKMKGAGRRARERNIRLGLMDP